MSKHSKLLLFRDGTAFVFDGEGLGAQVQLSSVFYAAVDTEFPNLFAVKPAATPGMAPEPVITAPETVTLVSTEPGDAGKSETAPAADLGVTLNPQDNGQAAGN